jgi:hypothetical protein
MGSRYTEMLCRNGRGCLAFAAACLTGCWPAHAAGAAGGAEAQLAGMSLGQLSNLRVTSGYRELPSRLGWHATNALEISLRGTNLLHSRHLEPPAPCGEYTGRSVFLRVDRSAR